VLSEWKYGGQPPEKRKAPRHREPDRKEHTIEPDDIAETAAHRQAQKLRRLYSFCQATACTIASLAFAGGPR
jgi:hypothetical protein